MPQPFDDAERDPAAAVDCKSGGLVERDQGVVLGGWRNCDACGGSRRATGRGRGGPDRWNSEDVPGSEARVGLGSLCVEPDLATAQDPVNVAFGDALQGLVEEIVDPLAVAILRDNQPIRSILA
jgi:hypothetical protein